VYLDPDGRDLEPATRHLWVEDVVAEADGSSSIGRVATARSHRSRGLAATLVKRALDGATRPVRLNAQTYLVEWYERLGFEASGEPFLDDGIPHTPMVIER
jgi:ElaA protein